MMSDAYLHSRLKVDHKVAVLVGIRGGEAEQVIVACSGGLLLQGVSLRAHLNEERHERRMVITLDWFCC